MAWPSSFPAGSLGYLKDRIADELMRSDLTTQIATAINDAITIYQKENFRFTETFSTTFRTRYGQGDYSILTDSSFPAVSSVRNVFHIAWCVATISRTVNDLARVQPEEILLARQDQTQSGPPDSYAVDNETILLYPIPDLGLGEIGGVTTLNVTTGGSGYATGIFTAALTGGTGSGATASITVVAGVVTAISIIEPGSRYVIGDVVSATAASLGVQQLNPVSGMVSVFSILSGGSGYLAGTFTNVALTGGTGTGATGNITVSQFGGSVASNQGGGGGEGVVTNVQIVNPGSGYQSGDILSAVLAAATSGSTTGQIGTLALLTNRTGLTNGTYTLPLVGGTGTGATATVVVAGTTVTSVTLLNPGLGYTLNDTLGLAVPGSTGAITTLSIITGGAGYTDGIYVAQALTGGSGSGATATIVVSQGTVVSATIVAGGTGYLAGNVIGASGLPSGGNVAPFSASVAATGVTVGVTSLTTAGLPGFINGISTLNGGSGYTSGTYMNVALTGGAGTGATANITVSGGSITSIAISNPGNGYIIGNVLSASGLGPGSGFNITVSLVVHGAVSEASAGGFQLQINDTSSGPASSAVSGSGFTATITAVLTTLTGYEVKIGGNVAYGAPSNDSQTGNRWMTDAERLIRARAKYEIAMNVTRNMQMADAMSPFKPGGQAYEAFRELTIEANRIQRRGVIRAMSF